MVNLRRRHTSPPSFPYVTSQKCLSLARDNNHQLTLNVMAFTITSMQKSITASSSHVFHVSSHLKTLLLPLLILLAFPILYNFVPIGDDWAEFFRPAAISMVHGGSPFLTGFYNAPWVLVPLIPIALLPFQMGRTIFFILSLAGFAYIARRLTSKPISIMLFMTSAPVVFCLYGGNLDWIPMLSFVTPAPLALILAATKPQIGAGVALYWLFESWHQGGTRTIMRNFLPVTLLLIASFVFYGLWPLRLSLINDVFWNVSAFPYMVPFGILFVGWAVAKRQPEAAMAAGLCFSPYYSIRSLFVFLAPLFERPRLLVAAWLILWIGILVYTILA